jgi:hypothetical protein
MVNDINKEIGDDGKPVFSPPLVVRTAKDRLKDYVKFANGIHSHVVNSTGCDNMPAHTEIQRLLIDVLELYREHQKKDKVAKDALAMKKKDRSDAVECREESLAIFTESTKELEQLNLGDTTTAKKHRKSAPPPPTDGMDVLMDKKNLMEGRKYKKDILERCSNESTKGEGRRNHDDDDAAKPDDDGNVAEPKGNFVGTCCCLHGLGCRSCSRYERKNVFFAFLYVVQFVSDFVFAFPFYSG